MIRFTEDQQERSSFANDQERRAYNKKEKDQESEIMAQKEIL